MSSEQSNGTCAVADVPSVAADLHAIVADQDANTASANENAAPTMQRVKSSNLLRTSPIVAETKKRKRGADEDYANAFADTTNIHGNGSAPLSPNDSPTKKRKKLTDEEKAEREKQRLEREEKRQQELKEKEERKLKKEEERKQREEERRLKEEERKQKEAEREEQKRAREEDKRRKEEERRKKDEDKEKLRVEREEERRKKEDERRKKEEERERAEEEKKRQAEKKRAYWGQFKASSESSAPHSLTASRETVAPSANGARGWSTELCRAWQPAAGAVIAPLQRWHARDASFAQQLASQNAPVSVAALPKPPRRTRRAVLAARKVRRVAHYQHVIDLSGAADPQLNPLTDRLLHARFKYLNFHENVRPAYYGTFSAQCRRVTARRPFGQDARTFGDYEYDSDEDWEEEEGEDLDAMSERSGEEEHASAAKELEGEEDYCYDGEFLVADGYLSDEEGRKSDSDSDEERDLAPTAPKSEEQRARDAERRQERIKKMMAHKKRAAECQAVVAGPVYHPSSAEERVRALITCYPAELLLAHPIDPRAPLAEELDEEVAPATPKKAKVVPDALVPDLIRALHGASSRSHVVDAFHKLHAHISKRQIERKIVEIAARGAVDDGKTAWVVRPEIVARYSSGASQVLPNLEVKPDTASIPQADLVPGPSECAVTDTCQSAALVQ